MSQTAKEPWLSHLKAWMMTVPKRMKRAEKISDRMGIISRLDTKDTIITQNCNIMSKTAIQVETHYKVKNLNINGSV